MATFPCLAPKNLEDLTLEEDEEQLVALAEAAQAKLMQSVREEPATAYIGKTAQAPEAEAPVEEDEDDAGVESDEVEEFEQ